MNATTVHSNLLLKSKQGFKKIFEFFIPQQNRYKLPYIYSYLKSFYLKQESQEETEQYDLVFVIDKGNKGWILDAVCQEIAKYFLGRCYSSYAYYFPGKNVFTHAPEKLNLPLAKAYFFAHYSYFAVCLRLYPNLWKSKSFIYYTHPKGIMSDEEFVYVMNFATKIICMCSEFANLLVKCGIKSQKVTYLPGAADPKIFRSHQRTGEGAIGFCTAYYPRKNPELILNIVKLLPSKKFILLGKDWEKYEKFTELIALSNMSYIKAPYSEYPNYYEQMDVFVCPAKLEGGPIPLIETMMCNIVPVASKTGFAPDIINDGENGLLFDIDSPAEAICELIEQAFQIKTDIRKTVEHLSWKNFSLDIQKILQLS